MRPTRQPKFRDPDVEALVRAAGGQCDAKALIIRKARELNADYRRWDRGDSSPIERLTHLASLRGLTVSPMGVHAGVQRDAAVLMSGRSAAGGGQVFYNPSRPSGRIAFSIAHEIVHTFFPATEGGVRFREMLDDETEQLSELELLCHVGAAELLMPIDEFQANAGPEWSIRKIPRLVAQFGASFEATVFRLATAHPERAASGSLSFRRTKDDQAKILRVSDHTQGSLFAATQGRADIQVANPKYRRQSFHTSETFPVHQMVHWNKSFDTSSCVYRASELIVSASESLPVRGCGKGIIEAVQAPYQRADVDPDHPDVLFFWKAA